MIDSTGVEWPDEANIAVDRLAELGNFDLQKTK